MLLRLITVIQLSSAVIASQPARRKEILKGFGYRIGNALAAIRAQDDY